MTLNITVTTPDLIYQCADFRYTDWATGEWRDSGQEPKIHLVTKKGWHALVCFNGVGHTGTQSVSAWLQQAIVDLPLASSFDDLLHLLGTADEWLSRVPPPLNRHSFVVGGFDGLKPVYCLVTNYEDISGHARNTASPCLEVVRAWPKKPKVFISGAKSAVPYEDRLRLKNVARLSKDPARVVDLMTEVNRRAAQGSNTISSACFTMQVGRTGRGAGQPQGISVPPPAIFGLPPSLRQAFQQILDEQFPQGAEIRSFSSVYKNPSHEIFRAKLKESPDDPNIHYNYGVFLHAEGDTKRVKYRYLEALKRDPTHVNAIGNLANLAWKEGKLAQAKEGFEKALAISPTHAIVSCSYGRFLLSVEGNIPLAKSILQRGVSNTNTQSPDMHFLLADIELLSGNGQAAMDYIDKARDQGGDQKTAELQHAIALHMSGGDIGECIAAYRTAIALDSKMYETRLNLAQLLFVRGESTEAEKLLRGVLAEDTDPATNLEAQFYRLAHTNDDSRDIFLRLRENLARSRLNWNLEPNIEAVRQVKPWLAEALVRLEIALRNGQLESLDGIEEQVNSVR